MRIETKLTERDQKLIAIVGPILVVVVLAWAFIVPLWNAHGQLEQQAEEVTAQVQEISDPATVQGLEADTKATRAGNAQALEGFYPAQTEASITRLGTQLAKGHGLKVRDLTFALATGAADATGYTAGGSAGSSGSSSSGSSASGGSLEAAPTGDAAGIMENRLQLTVSGTRAKLQKLVDDCAGAYGGIRVQSFSWTQASTQGGAQGKKGDPWQLTLLLSVYSYES